MSAVDPPDGANPANPASGDDGADPALNLPEEHEAERFMRAFESAAPALHAWAILKCRGPIGRAVTPEDLEQEVCLQALQAFSRYDSARGAFRPWMFGVASRVAAEALRRLARGKLLPGSPLSQAHAARLPAELTTISRRARRDEAVERVLADLDGLNEDDRRQFLYRGLEGLSHAQTAAMLGISEESAAKRWQRIRERLQGFASTRALLAED